MSTTSNFSGCDRESATVCKTMGVCRVESEVGHPVVEILSVILESP